MAERVNVSLPRKLREEMSRTPGINWSQVAADAFRRAIEERRRPIAADKRGADCRA